MLRSFIILALINAVIPLHSHHLGRNLHPLLAGLNSAFDCSLFHQSLCGLVFFREDKFQPAKSCRLTAGV